MISDGLLDDFLGIDFLTENKLALYFNPSENVAYLERKDDAGTNEKAADGKNGNIKGLISKNNNL